MKVKKENGEAESTTEQKESKKEHLNVKVYFFVLFQFVLMYHMIGSLYDCQFTSWKIYRQMKNGGICRCWCEDTCTWLLKLLRKVKRDVK